MYEAKAKLNTLTQQFEITTLAKDKLIKEKVFASTSNLQS